MSRFFVQHFWKASLTDEHAQCHLPRYFIKLSEDKAEDARSKASGQLDNLADVDDLEEADTPEDLILSTMTTENTQVYVGECYYILYI